jgi:hypothetical protein
MLYTVESATRTLPYVRAITAELRELHRSIQIATRKHDALPAASPRRNELRTQIREKTARLEACQAELGALGLLVKDYELGLIDFPSELEGRPIYLCWEMSEERVAHWHEPEEGYRGRRPVPNSPHWPLGSTVEPAARD